MKDKFGYAETDARFLTDLAVLIAVEGEISTEDRRRIALRLRSIAEAGLASPDNVTNLFVTE